jgi:hypothetical protein
MDQAWMADMKARGRSFTQIAEEFKALNRPYSLTRTQFSYDWKSLAAHYAEQTKNSFDAWRNELLAGIQAQELALWKAWEKSLENQITRKVEQLTVGNEERKKQLMENADSFGDVRIHSLLIELREQKMNLLGIVRLKSDPIDVRPMEMAEVISVTNTGAEDLERCLGVAIQLRNRKNESSQPVER